MGSAKVCKAESTVCTLARRPGRALTQLTFPSRPGVLWHRASQDLGMDGLASGVRQSRAGACLKGVRSQGHRRSEKAEERAGDLAVP